MILKTFENPMGIYTKNIDIIPHQKDTKVTTVIASGNKIQFSGVTKSNKVKTLNFEIVPSNTIKKERNNSYKYFSID